MKGGFLSKRQFARGWSLLALVVAMFGVGLMTTSGEVFADQRMCSTLQYTSNTEGYDSPSMKICANTNDDGVIQSGLSVSYTGNFNQSTFTNDPSYNGSVTIGSSNNTDGKGEISIKAVSSSSRGDGMPATANPSTVSYQYGSTSFSKLANSIFAPFSSGYSYAESESQTVQMVKIGEDGGCDATQLMGGSYGCEPGDYEVTKVIGDTGSTAFYYFEMNGSEWMLSCGGAAGCGAGNSVWTAALDPITVQYERKVIDHEPEPITGTEGEGEEGEDGDEEDDPCYSNSGAMGWIMCPIINLASDALQSIYDNILQDFLEIKPGLIASEADNGTYQAWNIFRNLANVALIIIFLVVIISQLTGYGISNYGIKRMLPRLVILAILINLSYLVCQLLVDLSNILGASINSFLESIASSLHDAIQIDGRSPEGETAGAVLNVALGVGGVALFATAGAISGWALILPILLAIVSAVLAALFMFILLGLRQALIVLIVALAPIIIVLYVLPNTQNIAKRGLNLFSGLLMMFPLAGLLVGGCHLASAILLTSTSGGENYTWMIQILGIILLVVPFFLLPWLIKSTFAAADSVLGAISARGQRFTGNMQGRARGAIDRSNLAQRVRQTAATKSLGKVQRRVKRQSTKLAEGRGLARISRGAASWRLENSQKKLTAVASNVRRSEGELDMAATAAAEQVYGNASNDMIYGEMEKMLDSGFAQTEAGQRQFAAMASILTSRGGSGVESMEKLMREKALGQDNVKNLGAFQKALTPAMNKQLGDASIAAGEMAKAINSVRLSDEKGKAIENPVGVDAGALEGTISQKMASASAAKIANQSSEAIDAALRKGYISEGKAEEIIGNPELRSKITGDENDPTSNISRLKAIAWPPEKVAAAKRQAQNQTGGENGDNNVILIPHGDAELNQATRQFRQDADQARRNRRK